MGRRSGGGGGGNAWNDFQRAHGGQGLSRGEMSAMYHASAATSVSSGGHNHQPANATRATSAWNGFQHEYGGRGLSKQDIKSLYAHQKGEPPAPVATTGSVKAWNEFQHEYAGTGLSRQQAAHLYHAQKQQQQQEPVAAAAPTRPAQKKEDPRPLYVPNPFESAFKFPAPSQTPQEPPRPNPTSIFAYYGHDARNQEHYDGVIKAESQYPAQQMPFTFGYGHTGFGVAAQTPSQVYQSPFARPTAPWIAQAAGDTTTTTAAPSNAAHRYYEAHETMVYLPFSVDSHGLDRSPEELAFKYYRRRQAKTKSVASAKAIFASAYAPQKAQVQQVPKSAVQATQPPPPPPPASRETKHKMALSTVKEEDEEDQSESRIESTTEREHKTKKVTFVEESKDSPTTEPVPASDKPQVEKAEVVKVEPPVVVDSKTTDAAQVNTNPTQPTDQDELSSASLVFSASHEDQIGDGMTGPTMLATIKGDAKVAVKLVPSLNSKRARTRLAKEAEALMKLPAHPNVVKFHSVEPLEDGKKLGVVTELVLESENLVTRLYSSKIPTTSEAARHQIILQLLDAIDHLHAHSITHRDLTPTHVLVSTNQDGSVALKLIDFGLPTLKNAVAVALTQAGVTGFNPAYASPELLGGQIPKHDVGAWKKSDIYSFAVVMMEILLEDQPWEGELPVFFMKAVAERGERPFDVDELLLRGRKSRVLERIVAQAWHQDPEKRPTASVLREMLTKVFGIGDQDASSPTSPKTASEESVA